MPFVVRLDGTNDVEGRELLQEAELPNVHAARDDERGGREGRRARSAVAQAAVAAAGTSV